jgi:serine/threonine-protein kinase
VYRVEAVDVTPRPAGVTAVGASRWGRRGLTVQVPHSTIGDWGEPVDVNSEMIERARARVGSLVNDVWHLDWLVGIGGTAAVFAATHETGRRAAIKMLHPELAASPTIRTRFWREASVASKVTHPGVVQVVDKGLDAGGCSFLIMELLEGETVTARLARSGGRFQPREAMWIVDRVLDVLVAAHGVNVLHRDLKPANVFLLQSGGLKLLDFGHARLGPARTARGFLLGTVGYMAPEQARGDPDAVDERTDLWGVGALLFTLLSGEFVHGADRSRSQQFRAAFHGKVARIADVRMSLSPEVAAFVDRALAIEKADRWPDARAMKAALGDLEQVVGAFVEPALIPRIWDEDDDRPDP